MSDKVICPMCSELVEEEFMVYTEEYDLICEYCKEDYDEEEHYE